MKLRFINYDDLDDIKANLAYWLSNFQLASSDWLAEEFGNELFDNTKYEEIPDFALDMSEEEPFLTEARNVQLVYGNLSGLSESRATDERLWAGLCLGPFWNYVRYRWDIGKGCTADSIRQHFMFASNTRGALIENALARLWWLGRLTHDGRRSDPWELTGLLCEKPEYITALWGSSISNNPTIVRAFLDALLEARGRGLQVNEETFGELLKHLNILGGIYILDCLSEQKIRDKILLKAEEVRNKAQ